MACLVPLQQIHGLVNTRKRFAIAILSEAILKGDAPVLIDVYNFIAMQTKSKRPSVDLQVDLRRTCNQQ